MIANEARKITLVNQVGKPSVEKNDELEAETRKKYEQVLDEIYYRIQCVAENGGNYLLVRHTSYLPEIVFVLKQDGYVVDDYERIGTYIRW